MTALQTRFYNAARVSRASAEDLNSEAGQRLIFEGVAAPYNSDSEDFGGDFYEQIAPGAFARSVDEANSKKINVHVFWQHDSDEVLGSTQSGTANIFEDAEGLKFTLNPRRMNTMQYEATKDGDVQVSVGMYIRAYTFEDDREDGKIILTVTDADLVEFSIVTYPAYPETSIGEKRSLHARQIDQRDARQAWIKERYDEWKAERAAVQVKADAAVARRKAMIETLERRASLLAR